MSTSSSIPPVQRKRTSRDLANAVDLRPRDIFDLHGVPSSTLHEWCTREHDRLPSSLIPGRRGKRGVRLVKRKDIEAFIEKFRTA
ncbi:MAG: hypothetical protein WC661_11870 [Opitutaceae bacterium]|jgi:hypothetical protein